MDLEMCETISIYNNRFCRVFRPEVDGIYNMIFIGNNKMKEKKTKRVIVRLTENQLISLNQTY